MKLRIQGNSLRLRLTISDLSRLADDGHISATVCFGPSPGLGLTYGISRSDHVHQLAVESSPQKVFVILPSAELCNWISTDQVGISGDVNLGDWGVLSILLEKDFACLDRSDEDNADMFPNPLLGTEC